MKIHLKSLVESKRVCRWRVSVFVKCSCLQFDLFLLQVAAELLDQKARQAAADVTIYMKRISAALESRERELLHRIEKARNQKFAALQERDDGIRNGIIRLTRAADKLSEVIESGAYIHNPLNLTLIKDMASAEVLMKSNI